MIPLDTTTPSHPGHGARYPDSPDLARSPAPDLPRQPQPTHNNPPQPINNATPPKGVIAPSHFNPLSDSKYKLPENRITPTTKAHVEHRLARLTPHNRSITPTASSASA